MAQHAQIQQNKAFRDLYNKISFRECRVCTKTAFVHTLSLDLNCKPLNRIPHFFCHINSIFLKTFIKNQHKQLTDIHAKGICTLMNEITAKSYPQLFQVRAFL
jgi:hypothetical protein